MSSRVFLYESFFYESIKGLIPLECCGVGVLWSGEAGSGESGLEPKEGGLRPPFSITTSYLMSSRAFFMSPSFKNNLRV